jgi:glutaredoxin-related protein
MANSIIIFSLNGCGHCANLKKRLTGLEIPFQDIEINSNREIWNQVVSQTGHNTLPTVFIKKENDENGPVYVPGRDFNGEDEIVEIIKTYL